MTATIEEAQAELREMIRRLLPGEELVITDGGRVVARLTAVAQHENRKARQPGTLRGTVLGMAADFDAPLEDFREYMG